VLFVHRDEPMASATGMTIPRAGGGVTMAGPTESLDSAARKLEG